MRHMRWMGGAVSGLTLVLSLGVAACDNDKESGGGTAPTRHRPLRRQPRPPSAAARRRLRPGRQLGAGAGRLGGETPRRTRPSPRICTNTTAITTMAASTAFISMAVDTLGLDAAKKGQLEKIQSDLQAKMAPARDAERDLMSTLADGVAAGKIDHREEGRTARRSPKRATASKPRFTARPRTRSTSCTRRSRPSSARRSSTR